MFQGWTVSVMTNKHKLTKEEQETVIGPCAADQEWDVVTADPRFIRYLRRRGWTLEPDCQFPTHLACRLPFTKLRVLRPEKRKRRVAGAFQKISSRDTLVSEDGELEPASKQAIGVAAPGEQAREALTPDRGNDMTSPGRVTGRYQASGSTDAGACQSWQYPPILKWVRPWG